MSQNIEIQELVNEITDFVNSFFPETDSFIACMASEHRTLQQSFTRLCLRWLEHCAGIDYRYDDRNRASHETAKKLIESFREKTGNIDPSDFLPII